MAKYKGMYGESESGNFRVIDSIGVPHPFMVTSDHVVLAADHYGGSLCEEVCRKIPCGVKHCRLTYEQHEQALLVNCEADFQNDEDAKDELHQYLLSIKEEAEKNGYAGFAFIKDEDKW